MKPKLTTFPSGLRLLVVSDPNAATATTLVLVGTGSNYESASESGIAHFLEHLYFKGTTTLPTSRDIIEEFERIGAISNAFTSNEYTGYYAKGSPSHVPTFIHVLADIYLSSTFPETEIEKEKGVVIEEINMYEDQPSRQAEEALVQLMYGDQPAGRPVIGTRENVRAFSRSALLKYERAHYHASNTVVVVSGAVDATEVRALVKNAFSQIKTAKPKSKKKVVVEKKKLKSIVVHKKSDQAHLCVGFHSVPLGHRDAPTATLLATVLGRGMSSRLFQTLREELGLAYYVGASQDPFTDYGLFSISAGVDKSKVALVCSAIAQILHDLATTTISASELAKAREFTLGTARLGLESSDEIAGFYGIQLLLRGSYKTLAELSREYHTVTADDIRRLARRIFIPANTSVAVVGPFETIDTSAFASL